MVDSGIRHLRPSLCRGRWALGLILILLGVLAWPFLADLPAREKQTPDKEKESTREVDAWHLNQRGAFLFTKAIVVGTGQYRPR